MITLTKIYVTLMFFKTTNAKHNLRNLNSDTNTHDTASIGANVPAASPLLTPTINERALKQKTSSPTQFSCNGDRWVQWEDSPNSITKRATKLGYNKTTWDLPGSADIEDNSWWGLKKQGLAGTAANIGWSETHWDCWVNHYEDYTWDEIKAYGLKKAFKTLGFDKNEWGSDEFYGLKDGTQWKDLTSDEQWAADQICYVPDSWESKPLKDWTWSCWES